MMVAGIVSFVFGSFTDKVCYCAISTTKKALLAKILILFLLLGGTIGGIVGKEKKWQVMIS